jgi:membrane fusion protein (multidrug efflux system)
METNNKTVVPPSSFKGRFIFIAWKNLPRFVLAGMIVLVIALMGVVNDKKEQLEKAKKAAHAEHKKLVNSILLDLKPRPIEDAMNLPGTIEPWIRLELMAKISGSITEVRVKEGDEVKTGQVLALMEPDDYRIALDAARAAHTLAKADYERNRAMHKTKVIPMANLETTLAQLQTTKAELEKAELQLARCTITAPMDAVIKRLDAKVGLFLSVGDPLAELLQIDRVKAVVGIPETDVDAVRRIEQVGVTIQALQNREVVGVKSYLASAPDSQAYLYRLELALDNRDHAILPGMFFRAHIVKRRIDQALIVPIYSIVSRNDEQFVFVAEGDTVRKQPVRLGVIEQWQVQVVEGLKAGDRVLVEGHREVESGQQIKIIKVVNDVQETLL